MWNIKISQSGSDDDFLGLESTWNKDFILIICSSMFPNLVIATNKQANQKSPPGQLGSRGGTELRNKKVFQKQQFRYAWPFPTGRFCLQLFLLAVLNMFTVDSLTVNPPSPPLDVLTVRTEVVVETPSWSHQTCMCSFPVASAHFLQLPLHYMYCSPARQVEENIVLFHSSSH